MNRIGRRDDDEVDRDFFRNFQGGHNWQHMLLYIFKNNKIVFNKADFEEAIKSNNDPSIHPSISNINSGFRRDKFNEKSSNTPRDYKKRLDQASQSIEEGKGSSKVINTNDIILTVKPDVFDTPRGSESEHDESGTPHGNLQILNSLSVQLNLSLFNVRLSLNMFPFYLSAFI